MTILRMRDCYAQYFRKVEGLCMARSSKEAQRALLAIALGQGGYFTAKQARESGYGYSHLDYHVSVGNFERVEQGLYRMMDVPISEYDDLMRLSLWSRNRNDEPQAVVSHDTALHLHEMGELLTNAVHLTVPMSFRKEAPFGCVLHQAELTRNDTQEWIGFRVTTPLRTLLDATVDAVSEEQLGKAARDALSRGLIRRDILAEVVWGSANYERLKRVLRGIPGMPSQERS